LECLSARSHPVFPRRLTFSGVGTQRRCWLLIGAKSIRDSSRAYDQDMSFGGREPPNASDADSFSPPTDEPDIVELGQPPPQPVHPPHRSSAGETRHADRRRSCAGDHGDRRAEVELNLEEPYPPVRILFGQRRVLVEDGPRVAPALRISATLADLVHMMVTPLLGGMPSPAHAHGRAKLGMFAIGSAILSRAAAVRPNRGATWPAVRCCNSAIEHSAVRLVVPRGRDSEPRSSPLLRLRMRR